MGVPIYMPLQFVVFGPNEATAATLVFTRGVFGGPEDTLCASSSTEVTKPWL